MEFACVLSRHSDFLPLSKDMHVGLISDSELPICVTAVCQYLRYNSKVYCASHPMTAGLDSSTPTTLKRTSS